MASDRNSKTINDSEFTETKPYVLPQPVLNFDVNEESLRLNKIREIEMREEHISKSKE